MKKEILVIDYEPTVLELLGFILDKDYNLALKRNCYEALLWLENRENPDLILLDLEMPCFDGREFINSLKVSGFYRDIPIVVLSDKDSGNNSFPFDSQKVEGYIKKPFNPIRLKEKIGEVIHYQTRKDELERLYN